MHLCLICDEYPPAIHGGIGTFSRELAEGLVSSGVSVTVVGVYAKRTMSISRTTEEIVNGVKVVCIPSASVLPNRARMIWDRIRLSYWLKLQHRKTPFDIIDAPEHIGWLAFGSPNGVPTVARFHGSQILFAHMLKRRPSRLFVLFEKLWIKRADFWVGDTDYAVRQTIDSAGISRRNYEVIYNAVDTNKFSPGSTTSVEQKQLIVFANSIHPRKGVRELVKAMEHVLQEHPHAHLIFIGKDIMFMADNRPYSAHVLEELASNVRSHITFTGWLERHGEVVEYLRRATVCCYPSHAEGFGIAPVEAMSVGKPTIFMRHGPGPEVIENGVSGLLCDSCDPSDIAKCILTVFDNETLAISLGEKARERVLEQFNKEKWVERNITYYEECINSYGRTGSSER